MYDTYEEGGCGKRIKLLCRTCNEVSSYKSKRYKEESGLLMRTFYYLLSSKIVPCKSNIGQKRIVFL